MRDTSASICNQKGELLFYTEGTLVWDKNGNIMPNASNMTGLGNFNGAVGSSYTYTSSTAQGAVVVPHFGNENQYYIFSLTGSERFGFGIKGLLYYSIVDMSLNGGLGDILPAAKGLLINDGHSERMIPVTGDGCKVWILMTAMATNEFRAYEVFPVGVNINPVVSFIPSRKHFVGQQCLSTIAISGNRRTIALANNMGIKGITDSADAGISIYSFDPSSGVVSSERILDTAEQYYSVCFSADGSKLYASSFLSRLVQFDLGQVNTAAITASKTALGFLSYPGQSHLRSGVDEKIYFHYNVNTLGRIDFPNLTGAGSGFVVNAVQLINNANWLGLPNVLPSPIQKDTLFRLILDTILCAGSENEATDFTLNASGGYANYKWNDGREGRSGVVQTPGTFWGVYEDYCKVYIDTFKVKRTYMPSILGNDTMICGLDEFYIEPLLDNLEELAFLWNDHTTATTLRVTYPGRYWVTVKKGNCYFGDSIQIGFHSYDQYLGDDVLICRGTPITPVSLMANAPPNSEVRWSDESSGMGITIDAPGVYWVRVSQPPCFGTDTMRIIEEICDCGYAMPNAFSPNGDGVNDIFKPVFELGCTYNHYQLNIYNKYGEQVYTTDFKPNGWDGYHKGKPADIGTYFYEIRVVSGTNKNNSYRKGDLTLIR